MLCILRYFRTDKLSVSAAIRPSEQFRRTELLLAASVQARFTCNLYGRSRSHQISQRRSSPFTAHEPEISGWFERDIMMAKIVTCAILHQHEERLVDICHQQARTRPAGTRAFPSWGSSFALFTRLLRYYSSYSPTHRQISVDSSSSSSMDPRAGVY